MTLHKNQVGSSAGRGKLRGSKWLNIVSNKTLKIFAGVDLDAYIHQHQGFECYKSSHWQPVEVLRAWENLESLMTRQSAEFWMS